MFNGPKIIFITGGSASGKTTLAYQMKEKLKDKALLISQDAFYKPTEKPTSNFDLPKAFDFELQRKVFEKLIINESTEIPVYDFNINDRVGTKILIPKEIIIFEGLFTFYDKKLLKTASLKIFVDTPADTRLGRRILRDVKDRGRNISEVIIRWNRDVQPSYKRFISQTKTMADMIIPWTIVNHRAIDFLIATISNLETKEILIKNEDQNDI